MSHLILMQFTSLLKSCYNKWTLYFRKNRKENVTCFYMSLLAISLEKYKKIFLSPCTMYCIMSILRGISNLRIHRHQRDGRNIVHHFLVVNLVRSFTNKKLMRPSVTRFTTNYFILRSILE